MSTYGIDLGTTYSCIAKLDQNGNPEVIENYTEGTFTLASAVFFEEDSDNIVVGEAAKEYMETTPQRLVQFAKREIGKPKGKVYKIDDKTYTPIEISALILKQLKKMAKEHGEDVSDVIITCPAYFGFEERTATKKAGELAGMNVLNIVNEPTAAAISYCYREFTDNRVVVVYDLGGGTFDVTILEMSMVKDEDGNEKQQMKVLSSEGNDKLGGKDWDDTLYGIVLGKYCQELDISQDELDADTRPAIRSKIEKIKKRLTQAEAAKEKFKSDRGSIDIVITRDEFEEATSHLVAQTMNLLDDALTKAGGVDIDKVLLVGGSTYMPMIRNAVEGKFPGRVQVENPERAVAKGAAIYASILVGDDDVVRKQDSDDQEEEGQTEQNPAPVRIEAARKAEISVVDQAPRSFGLGVNSEEEYFVDNLIMKGTEIPATATEVYGTRFDNQKGVRIRVFESMAMEKQVRPCEDEHGNPQDTKPEYLMKALGELTLELPPNTPAETGIEVTFMIDASGIDVTAKNIVTGETATTRLKYETSMTEEETRESINRLNMLTLGD